MSPSDDKQDPYDAVRLLQLVMDNIPQFIFWKDRDSVYLGCNQNFADAAGVRNPAAIAGKTDLDLAWTREEAEFFRTVDRRVMDADNPEYGIIEPQLQADGKQAWLRTNKIPLHDTEGAVVGILGTFEDITAEREAEEQRRQRQKMDSVGQLAGGVAHDFNNMLTAIMSAAELMRRAPDDAAQSREMLGVILKTSDRASELTRKLLAFSRQGRMELRPTDIQGSILDAVGMLERSIDRQIRVEVSLDADSAVVDGDPSELTAMMLNLGINARDAIEGAGSITISTRRLDLAGSNRAANGFELRPGPYIEVSIADTGEGIDEEVVDRIFEPFFTTKTRGTGTGLGLAAVYGTVKEHEGAIEVESRQGEGARFRILLPLSSRELEPVASPGEVVRGEGTLLVIDDESYVRRTARAILERLGYSVLTAANGREGLEKYRAGGGAIDGVILDMVMPEMGGAECLAELRRIDPAVRVLVCSGYSRDRADAIAGDRLPFLKKPYRLDELAETVHRLLDEG